MLHGAVCIPIAAKLGPDDDNDNEQFSNSSSSTSYCSTTTLFISYMLTKFTFAFNRTTTFPNSMAVFYKVS
jgi:hypothetical protein